MRKRKSTGSRPDKSTSLAHRAARHFTSTIKARGIRYFEAHDARVVRPTRSGWELQVEGNDVYEVVVSPDALAMYPGSCTCPAYADSSACKHLWASLLELDLLLGAVAKLGVAAPVFARNSAGAVVGWRDDNARKLCRGSFEIDLWGDGRGITFRDIAAIDADREEAGVGDASGGEAALVDEEWDPDDDDDDDGLTFEERLDDIRERLALAEAPGYRNGPHPWSLPTQEVKLDWMARLSVLERAAQLQRSQPQLPIEVAFLVDAGVARKTGDLVLWVATRKQQRDRRPGAWRLPRHGDLEEIARGAPDQRALPVILKLDPPIYRGSSLPEPVRVPAALVDVALTALFGNSVRPWHDMSARPRLSKDLPAEIPLDPGRPFEIVVVLYHSDDGKRSVVASCAVRCTARTRCAGPCSSTVPSPCRCGARPRRSPRSPPCSAAPRCSRRISTSRPMSLRLRS